MDTRHVVSWLRSMAGRCLFWTALCWPVAGLGEPSAPYFPLAEGNSWTYFLPFSGTQLVSTIGGTRVVNGVTTRVRTFSSGDQQFLTNDGAGIRLHGQFVADDPATPENETETQTFNPPVVLAGPDIAPGSQFTGSGTVTSSSSLCGTVQLSYASNSTVVSIESVSVPAGLFRTFQVVTNVRVTGNLFCPAISFFGFLDETSTTINYTARGVGPVFWGDTDFGGMFQLTSTNVVWTEPAPFTFTPQLDVPLGVLITSTDSVLVIGITAPSPISVIGGEYSVSGGPFTSSPGTVSNGQTVQVRVLSASAFSTTTSAILNIGGVTGAFDVTTVAADPVPDAFSFFSFVGAGLNSVVTSGPITVTGINTASPISVTGGQYSVNGGPFTASAGTVSPGDLVAARLTSVSTYGTTATAVVRIGGVDGVFRVTTENSPIALTPSTVNFFEPALGIGNSSTIRVVQVQNTGGIPIAISAVNVAGPSSADFDQTNNCLTTLDTNQVCTVSLTFTPSALGVRVADISFTTDLPADAGRISLIGNRGAGAYMDFNGNGRDDILWRHGILGTNSVWLMDGAARVTVGPSGGPLDTVPDGAWQVVGAGDFNADGKTDILWRHAVSGSNSIWLMDGVNRIGGGPIPAVPELNWQIAGVGDFDANGRADILWRHAVSGSNSIWLMDGATRTGGGPITAVPDLAFQIAGTGDFNGDGRSDILWRHAVSGSNSIWLMDGVNRIGGGPITAVPEFNWRIAGVGDFNADGRADILWRHAVSGLDSVWLMDGINRVGGGPTLTVPDLAWRIEQVSDFNADGKADILWRHSATGANSIWLMDGATRTGGGPIDGVPDMGWAIVP